MSISLEQFLQNLEESGIVDSETIRDLLPPKNHPRNAAELARALLDRKLLTEYQTNALAEGKAKSLVLGNYAILERIGAGGMGQVFKARHRLMHRIVAVKMMSTDSMRDKAAVTRFEREVSAAARLNHPNIVTAYDADNVAGVHLLAMEYVEGQTLAAAVKTGGPLPVNRAIDYVLQTARGLEYAHAAGIVHRDVKPANLLVDANGTVKILDLGLAHLKADREEGRPSELTETGTVMGTIDYMSPEQALDMRQVDLRTDIYSLGCTLYYLLTGRAPYSGETRMQKLLAHRELPIPSLPAVRPDVPLELDACFSKMLAKSVDSRYETMTEVIAELERLGGNLSGAVGGPPAADAPMRQIFDEIASETGKDAFRQAPQSQSATKRRLPLLAGLALGAIVLALILSIGIRGPRNGPGTPPGRSSLPEQLDALDHSAQSAGQWNDRDVAFAQWLVEVSRLPAQEQVERVAAKLQEYNPRFDGKTSPQIESGRVTKLEFRGDEVTNIAPVQALRHLREFFCNRTPGRKGRLTDISPLAGLPLEQVYCGLTELSDISPLAGARLTFLNIGATDVSDLAPLKGMPIRSLDCGATRVSDIAPLEGMPLEYLNCALTLVTDLSPIRGMPLMELRCDFDRERDTAILRAIPTLKTINQKPATEFWAEVEAPRGDVNP